MQTEYRQFSHGIDTDSALQFVPDGSVLSAVNCRIQRQRGQAGGSISFLKGNIEAGAVRVLLAATGTNTLLGKCVDSSNGMLYLFYHASQLFPAKSMIVEYNAPANTARIVIEDANVTGGLGFTASMFIDCEVAEGPSGKLLMWADGGEVKYVNLSTNYAAGTISQAQLNLITEPGMVPVVATRVNVSGIASTIQTVPVQFTYRWTNTDGFTSVLAPYSLTAEPSRASAMQSNPIAGNAVDLELPVAQQIPANWKRVELVARIIKEGSITYHVIERWDSSVPADVTAVTNHNSGATPLAVADWAGATLETVDAATAAKYFDSIPQEVSRLRLVANRLMVANFTEGYDTPTIAPGFSLTQNVFTASLPSSTTQTAYLLQAGGGTESTGEARDYYVIITRFGGKNYLLPADMSSAGKLWTTTVDIAKEPDSIWTIPRNIPLTELRELKETLDPNLTNASPTVGENTIRLRIIAEALGHSNANDLSTLSTSMGTFEVVDEPDELGSGGESRAFAPNDLYDYGIQYYDAAGRKSGVQHLGTETIPAYTPLSLDLTGSIAFTINNTVPAAIPSWATHYAIVFSRHKKSERIIHFVASTIKVALKQSDESVIYRGFSALSGVAAGDRLYGLAVSLTALRKYGYGYTYAAGDFIELAGYNNAGSGIVLLGGDILAVEGSYAIMRLDESQSANLERIVPEAETVLNSGIAGIGPERQDIVFATIYSGTATRPQLYEIAKFGPITGGAFGNFYDSGSLTTTIYGDMFTQKRSSGAGAATGLAVTPYELNNLVAVNDQGRIAEPDSVGQKTLENAYRWSNARIPGASVNGYASFDALDIDTTDITAGGITYLALTTRGAQDGGQLLILCESGSFAVLVGQQVITGASGRDELTARVEVVSKPNPLRGGWGCQSPRSVVSFEGKVWWVDAYKRNVIEFNESGAGNISEFMAARLFNDLLGRVGFPEQITCGVDPFAAELLVSLPTTSYAKSDLATVTGLPDPLDAATGEKVTYRYNYQTNRWTGSYTSGAEMVHVGDKVFGWLNGKLWREFVGTIGTYYETQQSAIVAIPFNAGGQGGMPIFKSVRSLKLATQRAPDVTWVVVRGAADGVAQAQPFRYREGEYHAAIMRNRVGFNAATSGAWQRNGVNKAWLKGTTVVAVLIWSGATATEIGLTSAGLGFEVSSGH